jgi:hypothetical protein
MAKCVDLFISHCVIRLQLSVVIAANSDIRKGRLRQRFILFEDGNKFRCQ